MLHTEICIGSKRQKRCPWVRALSRRQDLRNHIIGSFRARLDTSTVTHSHLNGFAQVIERIGLAIMGALCGLFVAALVAKANIEAINGAVRKVVENRCGAFSGSHEGIVSGGDVNWLINGFCGERLPAIDLAHVDLP